MEKVSMGIVGNFALQFGYAGLING